MKSSEIENLMNKRTLTKSDKEAIRAAADLAGLEYTIKQGCRHCYERLLLRLYERDASELRVSIDGYRFRKPYMSFKLGAVVYSNDTIEGLMVGNLHPVIIKANFVKAEKSEKDGARSDV